ncbi:MAG: hypothetical protein QOF78_823 [Phycisphaerales bacterium]|jgi:hypothetical protein|nr:hypothetical protein [Phycisphaerales bacterium]
MRATLARALRVFSGLNDSAAAERNAFAGAAVAAAISARASSPASMEPLEDRRLLSTYYVNTSGSDSASGTSTGTAWKSINRVNTQNLKAGDKVLFAGGQTFSGGLYIPSSEGGTASAPVTFSTYGTGRATIRSGTKAGIDVAQAAGISISNLNFIGSGGSVAGIWIHVDFANKDVSGVFVKNVDVSGYGREGMRMMIAGSGSSISNVKIEQSSFHDNVYGGLKITGKPGNMTTTKNYTIDHVKAYNNYGSTSATGVTGNGIYVADVDGALINRCIAYNNGKNGAAPVGIWAAGANRVTIQYCESYNNNTRTVTDGGGFDFDWDVSNSIMQYNYSHGNAGPGYILAAGTHKNSNNVIRYNVSENDGRKNGRAAIQMWGNVRDAKIYNNVVFISATGNSNTAALYAHDNGSSGMRPYNVEIRNNIFYTTGGVKLINTTAGVAGVAGGLKFAGNAYYSGGSTFKIQWGSSAYGSLADWRSAKGQEKLNGLSTGYQGDPKLTKAGYGGTFGNADNLKNLSAYRLLAGSPLINKGVAQPTFLSGIITSDFFGDSLPKGGKYDIGIDEVA